MNERDAFLAAIRAHPEDDVPRLVFADWLDEHDDPELAEFIRVQCELHPIRYHWHLPEVQQLLRRERQLIQRNSSSWLRGENGHLYVVERSWHPFERGLPEQLYWKSRRFNSGSSQFVDELPSLRHMLYHDNIPPYRPWLSEATWKRLDTLELLIPLQEQDIQFLLRPPPDGHQLTLRIWSGAAPRLLQQLLRIREQPTRSWRKIELVQWFDPNSPSAPRGWYEDPRANDPVDELLRLPPEQFELIKPLDWGFTLCGDLGGGYFAGHLKSGSPALVAIRGDARRVYLTTFDEQGRFSKTLWEDQFGQPWTLPAIQQRFGFSLGSIHAKEFRSGRLMLKAFPTQRMAEFLRFYNDHPQTVSRPGLGIALLEQMYYHRGYTLELDGIEHHVRYPMELFLGEPSPG